MNHWRYLKWILNSSGPLFFSSGHRCRWILFEKAQFYFYITKSTTIKTITLKKKNTETWQPMRSNNSTNSNGSTTGERSRGMSCSSSSGGPPDLNSDIISVVTLRCCQRRLERVDTLQSTVDITAETSLSAPVRHRQWDRLCSVSTFHRWHQAYQTGPQDTFPPDGTQRSW